MENLNFLHFSRKCAQIFGYIVIVVWRIWTQSLCNITFVVRRIYIDSFHIGGKVPKFSVIYPFYYGEFRLHIGSINAQTFSNIYAHAVIIILGSWLALNYIYLQFSSRADRSFGLSNLALYQPAGREASDARGVRPLSWLWWRPRMNQVMSWLRKRLKLFSERLMHESSHVLPWNLGVFLKKTPKTLVRGWSMNIVMSHLPWNLGVFLKKTPKTF